MKPNDRGHSGVGPAPTRFPHDIPIIGDPIRASPMGVCKLTFVVNENGSFTLVPDIACAPELEKTRKLGPENRSYFLSKVKTTDPELAAQIDALKKKKRSRK